MIRKVKQRCMLRCMGDGKSCAFSLLPEDIGVEHPTLEDGGVLLMQLSASSDFTSAGADGTPSRMNATL